MKRTHTGVVPDDSIPAVQMTEQQRQVPYMAASVLLDYPDEHLAEKIAAVESQLDMLSLPVQAELTAFLDAVRVLGPRGIEEHYVETFDQRRRCSLFLSYYAVGDTRQRGAAIVAFRQQLEALGFEQVRDELPDHLCVVLEAAALSSGAAHVTATEILSAHRDGLEVLRAALEGLHSPFAHLIRAVCMSLPPIDQETADRYLDLITSGPPTELVGLGSPLPFPTTNPDQS